MNIVDLWIADINKFSADAPLYDQGILSDEEQSRSCQYQIESDKRRYIVSRLLLRQALSEASRGSVSPKKWRFSEGVRGKLSIDAGTGLPDLQFNLSHSGRMVAVAVSVSCPVGVDVERIERSMAVIPVNLVLTAREREWLEHQPSEMRSGIFMKLWTVKEAYAKLAGAGMTMKFSSVEVELNPVRIVSLEGGVEIKYLALETRDFVVGEEQYHLCLAVARSSSKPLQVKMHEMY